MPEQTITQRESERCNPVPNPTPKSTAEEKIVELTQTLKVIEEMRASNFERLEGCRKALEESIEKERSAWRLCHKLIRVVFNALAKEQSGQVISEHLLEPKK